MNEYVAKPIQPALLFARLSTIAEARNAAAPIVPKAAASPPAVPASLDAPALNLDTLEGLKKFLSGTALREYLTLYLVDTEAHLARIRDLKALSDLAGIARDAHSLVSSAGNVGAERVSVVARALEHACREGDRDTASRLASELAAAAVVTDKTIRAWLSAETNDSRAAVEAS